MFFVTRTERLEHSVISYHIYGSYLKRLMSLFVGAHTQFLFPFFIGMIMNRTRHYISTKYLVSILQKTQECRIR